ncbi:hypothetical protein [Streptomyces thioluteus]|uniref:hypothetical protein n=1 Tax=Streptomyces thioluteus TaxID=66431 RepID=UPI0031EAF554
MPCCAFFPCCAPGPGGGTTGVRARAGVRSAAGLTADGERQPVALLALSRAGRGELLGAPVRRRLCGTPVVRASAVQGAPAPPCSAGRRMGRRQEA